MPNDSNDPRGGIRERLHQIQTLREQVRDRLHLAGVDQLVEWQRLEPESFEVEQVTEDTNVQTRLDAIVERLKKLRAAMP